MKRILFTLLIGVALLASSCGEKPAAKDKSKFQIYLCIGQSNMEGCADAVERDYEPFRRLKMLPSMDNVERGRKLGEWCDASTPISGATAGLSPSESFGKAMVISQPEDISIGLISVAIGGCDIRLFDRDLYEGYTATHNAEWFLKKIENYGGNPYARLIELAKKAQEDGVISGIILHQGEQNEGDTLWTSYVKTVYENILSDLGLSASDVPLIAGEVVPSEIGGRAGSMNAIINTLPSVIPTAKVVSGKGCGAKADSIHYNTQGVKELGRRYARAMLEAKGIEAVPIALHSKKRSGGETPKQPVLDIKEEHKK
ncbi:MAG: sialate O-acetylesterase [Rikenellaceae bacterium]